MLKLTFIAFNNVEPITPASTDFCVIGMPIIKKYIGVKIALISQPTIILIAIVIIDERIKDTYLFNFLLNSFEKE